MGDKQLLSRRPDWRLLLGAALVIAGFIVIFVGYKGIADTADVYKQFPYLLSGGVLGAGLIALGITSLVVYEHQRDRTSIGVLVERLEKMEERLNDSGGDGSNAEALSAQLAQVQAGLGALKDAVQGRPATRSRSTRI